MTNRSVSHDSLLVFISRVSEPKLLRLFGYFNYGFIDRRIREWRQPRKYEQTNCPFKFEKAPLACALNRIKILVNQALFGSTKHGAFAVATTVENYSQTCLLVVSIRCRQHF